MAEPSEYLLCVVKDEGPTQSLVKRINRKGLGTQPCGTPELDAGE